MSDLAQKDPKVGHTVLEGELKTAPIVAGNQTPRQCLHRARALPLHGILEVRSDGGLGHKD